jgi:tetratricopeptide (TPR) repeat protein
VALHRAGLAALQNSDWLQATESFAGAVALDPSFLLAHYGLGQAAMAQGRYVEAARAFATSRDLFRCLVGPGSEAGASLAGAIDEETRALSDAIRALERERLVRGSVLGQEMNRSSGPPLGASQQVLQRLETRLMELRQWKKDLRQGARIPASLSLALGGAYFQMGALEDAEREFQAVVDADPRRGDAQNNLAVVYMLTGRLEAAEEAVRTAGRLGTKVDPRLLEEIAKRKQRAPPARRP